MLREDLSLMMPLSVPHRDADLATIHSLIDLLCGSDPVERWRARTALVEIGDPAVPSIVEVLRASSECLRWEAAKILIDISDPRSAPAMVNALEDKSFGVRWLASEGLVRLGRRGLAPLMQALVERPESAWLREGAHHVLRVLVGRGLDVHIVPVLRVLEDIEPVLEVPRAAKIALDELTSKPPVSTLKEPRLSASQRV